MHPNTSLNSSFCLELFTLFSSKSFLNIFLTCFDFTQNTFALVALCSAYCLFFPVFFLVLHQAIKQRRQRRTTFAAASHSDLITYQSMAIQLQEVLGLLIFFCGSHVGSQILMSAGVYICSLTLIGKTFFHLLTCVERYLAVVHPIIYLRLKQVRRVSIPHISNGCVWLLSCVCVAVSLRVRYQSIANVIFVSLGIHLLIVLYCSISILYVLKRPGPGNNGRVDQSKQRAFYTIMAIMGAMVIRLGGNMIIHMTYVSHVFCDVCVLLSSSFWLDLPGTLALPLLFLYRTRKLRPRKSG